MTQSDDDNDLPPQQGPSRLQGRIKLSGFEFYTKTLGAPKYVVAPMVDQSELAWRLLSRSHGAHLCYTPMFHSQCFAKDPKYRNEALQTCAGDRPLIVQFCGNDPDTLLEAGLLAQDHCDAIDINLGCPQAIAKRGHYGSFLQDEWQLLHNIVKTLHEKLSVPVTCKIRVFEDKAKTIKYAQMLENAGCQLLTVHGRTREQKGPLTGLADWSYIKAVRENIKIPMFANGNIMSIEDVHRCLEETGVQGVMTAEGNLYNPALFDGIIPPTWQMANEYLSILEQYPCPVSYIRGHLFKLFHHLLNMKSNSVIRETLAVSRKPEEFRHVVNYLEQKYSPIHNGVIPLDEELKERDVGNLDYNVKLPPWLCQSYVRPAPEDHRKFIAEKVKIAEDPNTTKRAYFDDDGNAISRKKMKKLKRYNRRPGPGNNSERVFEFCTICENPQGFKCTFELCRSCCREKCQTMVLDCVGHKILIKTKRERAAIYDAALKTAETEMRAAGLEVKEEELKKMAKTIAMGATIGNSRGNDDDNESLTDDSDS